MKKNLVAATLALAWMPVLGAAAQAELCVHTPFGFDICVFADHEDGGGPPPKSGEEDAETTPQLEAEKNLKSLLRIIEEEEDPEVKKILAESSNRLIDAKKAMSSA